MTRALMEVISAGIVTKSADVKCYVDCTLLAATQDASEFQVSSSHLEIPCFNGYTWSKWGNNGGMHVYADFRRYSG